MQISQQHIIFDFDKTLATLQVEWQFWHAQIVPLIKKYQPEFDPNTPLDMSSIHDFIEQYGKPFRDAFVQMETQLELEHYQGYTANQPAIALLQQLVQQHKNCYLLTSNCREVVVPILDELNITQCFKKIVTVGDVANIKPSSAPFALIHDGSPKTEYLMIGDSPSDSGFATTVGVAYLDVSEISS